MYGSYCMNQSSLFCCLLLQAMRLVEAHGGIARAQELAAHHCRLAAESIWALPAACGEHAEIAREALLKITDKVLTRTK